ncbi:MAG: pyrroloquinoline quinone-dependent dehydrogenase [Bryobacterales bacterium]|nr:pyrroloquinoline quinone-dependent dehydrogenase [Bryobacterales bacterium]
MATNLQKTILGGCALLVWFAASGRAEQAKPSPGDWPSYNHDMASTRYSPLKQINTKNVAELKSAWTFSLKGEAPPPRFGGGGSEATPIVVNGVMYVTASSRVVALDAVTGKEIWSYTLTTGRPSTRGVAYWPGDKENPPRIIFAAGRNLMALNANTGKIDPGFGKEGVVDMVVGYSGVPTIFKNLVMVGASVLELPVGQPGDTRAYDARTGAKLWDFHTVPGPGEVGHETWLNDGWKGRSGTNVWAWQMTVDAQRGILYMPVGGPASNYYGGDRPGNDLFGNSVVAVDAETGKLKWYFQTVHHDLWDYDSPPAPVLLDITVNGKKIPAIAQIGKTGWMFILDRTNGKPVFGVEERKVAAGDVPGEWYSPTQPFPLKPPPLARMDYKPEDLVTAEDTTPEHAAACKALVAKSGGFYNAGPFTPFLLHTDGTPPKSSIIFPGATGGTNWGGMAVDPRDGYIFAYTQDQGQVGWTEKKKPGVEYSFDEHGSPLEYTRAGVDGPGPFHTFTAPVKEGSRATWPCQKPPWGRLTAVDANTGEFAWQVPFGITEDLGPERQNTGRSGGFAGPSATAGGLVFAGITSDNRFRAIDSKTGKELWSVKLDATATADPMTYEGKDGKQYVAIVAGLTLHVFGLP